MVELYHFWSSVCSVRCRMALEEKGVKWTSRYICSNSINSNLNISP
jgi:hypothetical protein